MRHLAQDRLEALGLKVTSSGPHFSTFGTRLGLEYTPEYFLKCLFTEAPFELQLAPAWSDDPWYEDQEKRTFEPDPGWECVHPGEAEGRLPGGNLCTINLLQGTRFMPGLTGAILLLEDDPESQPQTFERDLQSRLHQPGFAGVRGLVIGRFQRESHMDPEKLLHFLAAKHGLDGLPLVTGAGFGHTTPQFTPPAGGSARLEAGPSRVGLAILEP